MSIFSQCLMLVCFARVSCPEEHEQSGRDTQGETKNEQGTDSIDTHLVNAYIIIGLSFHTISCVFIACK